MSELVQIRRKPEWLKVSLPTGERAATVRRLLDTHHLNTVCESAACPNRGECWSKGTATFMILGNTCTRACGFCNIKPGKGETVNADEPFGVADSVRVMNLKHVVITSVARDDLALEGADHFAATIGAVREANPSTTIEVLIPDFNGREELLRLVMDAQPDILNHNVETVRRLSPTVRHRAKHERSLELLRRAKAMRPGVFTKSGLMAGVGETDEEVLETFRELRAADVDILTVGQYLPPSTEHLKLVDYVHPDRFAAWQAAAYEMGFRWATCSPLVRSSYNASDFYATQLGHDVTRDLLPT